MTNCTSVIGDHVLNLQKNGAMSNQNTIDDPVKTNSLSLLEQSNSQASKKTQLSKIISCLRTCCCCLCKSDSIVEDKNVTLPLLTETEKPHKVMQKEQSSTAIDNDTSSERVASKTYETSIQTGQGTWTKEYSKVSIIYNGYNFSEIKFKKHDLECL